MPSRAEDLYAATFETDRLIPVEVIAECIRVFTLGPIYQEELTRKLADVLRCRVTLVGTHGRFRTTTCEG